MKPFSMQDINDAVNHLERGKAADTKGINAEMIKYSTRRLKKYLLRLYNKSIQPHGQPPNWRDTTIKVEHKSGDPSSPMCSILILYKLFSQLFFKRRQPALDANTFAHRAGFRLGFSTTDHPVTFQRHQQSHRVAIDFKKSIRHGGTQQRMEGLEGSKAPRNHTRSYSQSSTTSSEQQCTMTSKSRHFHFEWGTKQGDPLSTLSFNSLLQYITKPRTGNWDRDNHVVRLGEDDPDTNLSNLRFEDDFLLISGSLKHTGTMLDDLTTATTAHGLQLHHN